MSKKNRVGRPRSPSHRVRRNRVVTFLTDREFEELRQLAISQGSTISRTCHKALIQHLQDVDNSGLQ